MKTKLLAILVIICGLNVGCRNLLSKYESDVTTEVTAQRWRRTIVVEQLEKKNAEDWEDRVPQGAKIISKFQAIHHYDGTIRKEVPEVLTRRVQCGSYTGGKGVPIPKYCDEKYTATVTRDVDDITKPVYATKVKYEFEVWTEKETKDFSGYDKDISKAGTVSVDNKTTRIGKSNDGFIIELKTPDGRTYPQNVTREVWEKLNKGQKIKCKINLNETLSKCEF